MIVECDLTYHFVLGLAFWECSSHVQRKINFRNHLERNINNSQNEMYISTLICSNIDKFYLKCLFHVIVMR
jgi:hypothetical protein